ncbi:MAG TPA: Flp pilus assembly protein CpaB [Gemmatirosa sp.]
MLSDHRYTAIFGAALLTASGATFAVYRMLGTARTPQRESVRSVVVAVRDVPVGVPVPREALGVASWPARVAPAESFGSADSVAGRVTRAPLMPGEPVLMSRLAARGAAPGLEGAIDPTRRAMAVRVNEAASVSGLVRQNSRVDVLIAGRGDVSQATARVLMSDVRVLGVGSVRPPDTPTNGAAPDPAPSATTASIVTLEVTPAQAELLAAAEGQGAIQVVLRGYGSTGTDGGVVAMTDGSPTLGVGRGSAPGAPGPLGSGTPMMRMSVAAPGGPQRAIAVTPAAARAPHIAHVALHADHGTTAARVVAPEVATREPVALTRPESTTVHVYRGGTLTVLRVEATESVPTTGAGVRDGEMRPVRTADAQVGPHGQ